MLRSIPAVVAATAIVFYPQAAFSCCMVPAKYGEHVRISQNRHEAILFHADGREELILRINYKLTTADKDTPLPSHFAWVITVPNEPDKYAVRDAEIFEQVFDWAMPKIKVPTRARRENKSEEAPASIELGRRVVVGPYDIQPVRARGASALEGLNDWLKANGFPTEPPEHMKYFVKNKFTFLCIKIVPGKDKKAVQKGGDLPPMHLSFKSDKPYYPLRFSSRQGVFDLFLWSFTKKKLDYTKSSETLANLNLSRPDPRYRKNVSVDAEHFPEQLAKAYTQSRFAKDNGNWYLNLMEAERVNDRIKIAKWKKDVFFELASP